MGKKQENLLNICKTEKTANMVTKSSVKNTKSSTKNTKIAAKSSEGKKDRLISNEIRRLGNVFKNIDSEKKRLVKATIEDVAFLTISMNDLRKKINEEGMETEYQNGKNQWGMKQSPAVVSYLQMSQKLTAAMKILIDCQTKNCKTTEISDKFDDFVQERGID